MSWIASAAFFGWLGFTVGYFYRKWLELRWVPAYREQGKPEDARPPQPPGTARESSR